MRSPHIILCIHDEVVSTGHSSRSRKTSQDGMHGRHVSPGHARPGEPCKPVRQPETVRGDGCGNLGAALLGRPEDIGGPEGLWWDIKGVDMSARMGE